MVLCSLAFIFLQPPAQHDAVAVAQQQVAAEQKARGLVLKWVARKFLNLSIWRTHMAEQMRFSVTREKLEDSRKRLSEAGIPVIGDAGEVTQRGFTVAYSYNEPAAELTLILKRKPILIPASMIKDKVREALEKEGIREL